MLFRDLVERHDVSHPRAVSDLASRLVDNTASLYSVNRLTGYLESLGHRAPKPVVSDCLEWFEDAFFLSTVRIFDVSPPIRSSSCRSMVQRRTRAADARTPGRSRRSALSRPAPPTILGAITAQEVSGDSRMAVSSIDRATENLVKWASRGEWEPLQEEFYGSHLEPVVDGLEIPDDIFERLPDEVAGVVSVFILEDFFTTGFGEHGELNVVDDYLKRRGWRESVPGRRYLKALRDSTLSFYEIVDVVPGQYVTVRDLMLGGEVVRVDDKLGSEEVAPWDRLAARIVAVHGKNRFTSAVLRFRHELSQRLLAAFESMAEELERRMRGDARERQEAAPVTREMAREVVVHAPLFARTLSQFWLFDAAMQAEAPAPELRNTDDEAVLFCEVRFPLEGEEDAGGRRARRDRGVRTRRR